VRADATPNDPLFLEGQQWALRNTGQNNGVAGADIRAEEAWEVQTNTPDVVVAVIDSGIRLTHEDLFANLWINPGEAPPLNQNTRDDDRNGYIDDVNGINSLLPANTLGNGSPDDAIGHGTAVASVIGALGNNSRGMAGVAWRARLMALRFIDSSGFGYVSDEIECIDYAIAKGAHIINASFGGSSYSQSLFDALRRARDAGIVVVCSAGNDGEDADFTPHYPSNYLLDNIVSVANSTRTDTLSAASTYGSGAVDLAAPGSSIVVADSGSNNGYRSASGTSYSAAMVSGALALLKQTFPGDSYRGLINRLLRSVDRRPAFAGKTATGGRLNLAAALRSTERRPFNDDFAHRAQFASETGTARGSAQFATREPGEPTQAAGAGVGSLWWTWTAPRSGALTLDTTGSAFDTVLAVYTGTALPLLAVVASNDNESASVTTSRLTFNATAGTTYHIAVESKSATSGLVALRFSLVTSNDAFASAQLMTGRSWSVLANNRAATREDGEPRIRNNTGGRSVWYRWTAPVSRRYHLASFSSDFNTMVGVYTGSGLVGLSEVNSATSAGDSNFTMTSGGLSFSATAGTTYHICLDSEVSTTGAISTGEFRLSLADSEWEFFCFGAPSTVAIAPDGTLHFVDTLGYLYALNPDGSRKWRYSLSGYGTVSSPAVGSDGTVYVGDSFYYVHAVNPDGTRKWRTQTQGIVQSSPALAGDGTILVRSDDGLLSALDPSGGNVRWTFRTGTGPATTYSSPAIAPDGTVYCAGADSRLYAISPNGVARWNFPTDFIFASPTIANDGTVYFGVSAPTRRFYALNPDGSLKWEYIVGDTVSSSAAIGLDGTVYFGCADRKLYALSSSGQLRWTYETGDAIRRCSPAVASDGTIYFGSLDGKMYALDRDGNLRRSYATAQELRDSPILHNGRLYVASYDYRLYAFEVGNVPASTAWPMHRQNARRTARHVPSALAIGVQPRAQSAEVGDVITFTIGAVGHPAVSYQWLFQGQPLAGATSPSFRVDPVSHASAGSYSVRVTDSTGSLTSSVAALTVTTPLLPPTITSAPAPQTLLAGNRLSLAVAATGTSPLAFQWLRDGNPIPGATASSFAVELARTGDSGSYSVRISNPAGSITSPATTVAVAPISRISNLSIRSQVGAESGALTLGFMIGGEGVTGAKSLLVRAVGPTLAAFGVGDALADPQLALLSGSTVIAQNNDWGGGAQISGACAAVGAFGFATGTSRDAALVVAPNPGGYTARITGPDSTSGIALAEVYDTSPPDDFFVTTPRLVNVSALTRVGTGGEILIAGFSITGVNPKTVLVRGIGPALAAFGVAAVLADPKLDLYPGGGAAVLATNDNWSDAANATAVAATAGRVGAFALASPSRDSVLLVTLPPGSYTAHVSGVGGTVGTALVEVYEVP
jgi:outer membrane protein assembly factor BamB/subtilisin family serine protease